MNDLGYIAACERTSPNAPEFDNVLATCRRHQACLVVNKLKAKLFDALNSNEIDDESYCQIDDALSELDFD